MYYTTGAQEVTPELINFGVVFTGAHAQSNFRTVSENLACTLESLGIVKSNCCTCQQQILYILINLYS